MNKQSEEEKKNVNKIYDDDILNSLIIIVNTEQIYFYALNCFLFVLSSLSLHGEEHVRSFTLAFIIIVEGRKPFLHTFFFEVSHILT